MKYQKKASLRRNAASHRLQAPDQTDLVWKQYGQALVTQYPPEEWPRRLEQIPKIYRDSIRSRLIRDYGHEIILSTEVLTDQPTVSGE